MKKVVLISALFVVGFVSCTKDMEDLQLQESSNVGAMRMIAGDLQYYHDKMLVSSSYGNFKISLDAFVTKLGVDGQEEEFENEADMLDWIDVNISKTGFLTYNDAEVAWELVKDDFELVITDNPDLFSDNWDEEDWNGLILPTDEIATSTDDCTTDCSNELNEDRLIASVTYTASIKQANTLYQLNASVGAIAITMVQLQYLGAEKTAKRHYSWCLCLCDPIFCN